LYTHQTAILNTFSDNGQKFQANNLNPGFLTWGHGLRELGYQTAWWGKWHESPATPADLASEGFPADLERYVAAGSAIQASPRSCRLELENSFAKQPWLTGELEEFIRQYVLPNELRQPLPAPYSEVHDQAINAYLHGIQT
jgi:arylsulfatase A-like enzyme